MKKKAWLLVFLILICSVSAAMVLSPALLKERYNLDIIFIEGEGQVFLNETNQTGQYYVVINNNTRCSLSDFVYQACGKEYMASMPCVAVGQPVWPFEHCCNGAEPYLKPNVVGQQSCTKISDFQKIVNDFRYNTMLVRVIAIILILLLILQILTLIFKFIKKRMKSEPYM